MKLKHVLGPCKLAGYIPSVGLNVGKLRWIRFGVKLELSTDRGIG